MHQNYYPAPPDTFQVKQDLVAGNNTITHNKNLPAPFATIVQVRDDKTGAETAVRVIGQTANSLIINSPSAAFNQRITII